MSTQNPGPITINGLDLGTLVTGSLFEIEGTDNISYKVTMSDIATFIGSIASPLTTKGDLYGFSTGDARVPVGTDGQILVADSAESTGLKWENNITQTPWTQDIDGASFSLFDFSHLASGASDVAQTGSLRLGNNQVIAYRNDADTADLFISVTSNDILQFDGQNVVQVDRTQTLQNKTISATSNTITNIGSSEIISDIITGQTLKGTPVSADQILIADSEDSDNLKRITLTDLLAQTSLTPWTSNIDGAGFYVYDMPSIRDASQNEILVLAADSTPVNYLEVTSANTGVSVGLLAEGDDTDVNLVIACKGSGVIQLFNEVNLDSNPLRLLESTPPSATAGQGFVYGDNDGTQLSLFWNDENRTVDIIANLSPLTTKGDIFTYDTGNARLPVGTNGQALLADSAEATGLKWADIAVNEITDGTINGFLNLNVTTTGVSASTNGALIVGCTAGGITITVSTADIVDGRIIVIKDQSGTSGSSNISVVGEGGELIDGLSTVNILSNYGVLRLYAEGGELFSW